MAVEKRNENMSFQYGFFRLLAFVWRTKRKAKEIFKPWGLVWPPFTGFGFHVPCPLRLVNTRIYIKYIRRLAQRQRKNDNNIIGRDYLRTKIEIPRELLGFER